MYRDLCAQQAALLTRIHALVLPANPLDTLIDELGGTDAVAEMTGVCVGGGVGCVFFHSNTPACACLLYT